MRSLSAAGAALMFSAFVGVAAPAHAVSVITDTVIGPNTVFSGPQNDFSYTHTITPTYIIGTPILSGSLTIDTSNPTGTI